MKFQQNENKNLFQEYRMPKKMTVQERQNIQEQNKKLKAFQRETAIILKKKNQLSRQLRYINEAIARLDNRMMEYAKSGQFDKLNDVFFNAQKRQHEKQKTLMEQLLNISLDKQPDNLINENVDGFNDAGIYNRFNIRVKFNVKDAKPKILYFSITYEGVNVPIEVLREKVDDYIGKFCDQYDYELMGYTDDDISCEMFLEDHFEDIPNYGLKLSYVDAHQYTDAIQINCVIDGITTSLSGKINFMRRTIEDTVREFAIVMYNLKKDSEVDFKVYAKRINKDGVTIAHIKEWVRRFHSKSVSLYIFTPLNEKYYSHIAEDTRVQLKIKFNNQHAYFFDNDAIEKAEKITVNKIKADVVKSLFVSKNDTVMVKKLIDGEIDENVFTDFDTSIILSKITEVHGLITTSLLCQYGNIDKFIHPKTNKAVIYDASFNKNVTMWSRMSHLNLHSFSKIESVCKLARNSFEFFNQSRLPEKSVSVLEDLQIYKKAFVRSLNYSTDEMYTKDIGIDTLNTLWANQDIRNAFSYVIFKIQYIASYVEDEYKKTNNNEVIGLSDEQMRINMMNEITLSNACKKILSHYTDDFKTYFMKVFKYMFFNTDFDEIFIDIAKEMNICIHHIKRKENEVSIDIKSCYAECAYNMNYDFCIYDLTANFENYVESEIVYPGCYILTRSIVLPNGVRLNANMAYSHNLIDKFIKKGYLYRYNIKYQRIASHVLKHDIFRKFIDGIRTIHPVADAKIIINSFIGWLAKKYKKVTKSFMSDCEKYINAYVHTHSFDDFNKYVDDNGNQYVTFTSKSDLYETHTPINDQIISQSICDVSDLIDEFTANNAGATIKYIRTDAVGFTVKDVSKVVMNNPKYRIESADKWNPVFYKPFIQEDTEDFKLMDNVEWKYHESVTVNDTAGKYFIGEKEVTKEEAVKYRDQIATLSIVIEGGGGSGKTFLMNTLSEGYHCERFTPTNKNASNMDIHKHPDTTKTLTLETKFFADEIGFKYDTEKVVLDEVYNTNERYMRKILFAWLKASKNSNIIMQAFGDNNQCRQVAPRHVDYSQCRLFFKMFGGNRMIKLSNGFGRYEEGSNLEEMTNNFFQTGKLDERLLTIRNDDADIHITPFSQPRKDGKVNTTQYNKKFIENRGYKVGDLVLSKITNNSICIQRSGLFKIIEINENGVILKSHDSGVIVKKPIKTTDIEPAKYMTTYVCQGSTLRELFITINDILCMDKNQAYVALTRATHEKYISIVVRNEQERQQILNHVFKVKEQPVCTKLELKPLTYEEIYEIRNDTTKEVYVGRSQDSDDRFIQHLNEPNDPIKGDGWKMSIIRRALVDDNFNKKEIDDIETYYINEYKKNDKYTLINTRKVVKEDVQQKTKETKIETKHVDALDKLYRIIVTKVDVVVRDNKANLLKKFKHKKCGVDEAVKRANQFVYEHKKNLLGNYNE